jgi:putative ABC transport system permease protein
LEFLMPVFVKARSFLRNILSWHSVDADLDKEVHSHLEMLMEENLRAGMPENESRRLARVELGGIEQVKEQVREQRLGTWVHSVYADCRFALRQLRKNPGFTFVAIFTLALGIALNASIFSLVSAFILQRPPGRDPERVAVISSVSPTQGFQSDGDPVSVPNYLVWRQANHSFADVAADGEYRSVNLTHANQSEAVQSAAVTPNYFAVLGVSPELGRIFSDGEDHLGRDHVVILSHELWERQFASDPAVIGRTIRLNREDYTIIGVTPASFRLLGYTPKLWTPLTLTQADQLPEARKDRSLLMLARLKPGVTLEQARAEMAAFANIAETTYPDTEKGWGATVRTLPDFLVYSFGFRSGALVLMATAGFVLTIACANVAGLLLARSTARRREMAVRIALGAGRLRIIRQVLVENLLIATLGGAIGIVLAYWGIDFLRSQLIFNEAISAAPIHLDGNVLWFAVGVSLSCTLLCGIAPALHASRTDINISLKDEGRASSTGRSHTRLRTVMVTAEIALTVVLLIGTGLLIRSIYVIEHQKLGFRTDHLLTARITLDAAEYRNDGQRSLFVENLLPRLQHLPGVEAVAAVSHLPGQDPEGVDLQIRGQAELPASQKLSALFVVTTNDYFQVADIPLLRGRTFTNMDDASAPHVIVISQEFVHRLLKDREPLGQQIRLDIPGSKPGWCEIVGVVGDVKRNSEELRVDPQVYEPFMQHPVDSLSLLVSTNTDPNSLVSSMRGAVAQLDPELPLNHVIAMPRLIERQRKGNTLFVRILGSFAALALLLAAIGIYGLVSYSVARRTHEIGIRMALGAAKRDVLRLVLWQGLKTAAFGVLIGLVMAVPLPKIFESMFYEIHFRELRLFYFVPIVVVAVTMFATFIPAQRASRVDPMLVLRQE